jgi:hypothetical protein
LGLTHVVTKHLLGNVAVNSCFTGFVRP